MSKPRFFNASIVSIKLEAGLVEEPGWDLRSHNGLCSSTTDQSQCKVAWVKAPHSRSVCHCIWKVESRHRWWKKFVKKLAVIAGLISPKDSGETIHSWPPDSPEFGAGHEVVARTKAQG